LVKHYSGIFGVIWFGFMLDYSVCVVKFHFGSFLNLIIIM